MRRVRRPDSTRRDDDGPLLHDGRFMGHVTVQCLATAGFFTYIGGSSFVLRSVYGIGAST